MDLTSNKPFWLIKNGLIHSYPSLKKKRSCDVLIVGSGITGSLVAHQCIKDGCNTILIDKREIGNGSSSATTSMLQYEIDIPLYQLIEMIGQKNATLAYQSCSEAIDQLKKIVKEIKSESGFRKKKSLYFAYYKKDISWLQQEYQARKKAGFHVKWLEEKEIVEKYSISNAYGAILSKQGASVDAFKLLHEILDFNKKKGLEIYDKTELKKVIHGKNSSVCYINNNIEIEAKKIIYCVGYESQTMIKEKFVNLISTYAIISEIDKKQANKFKDLLIWNTAKPYVYMRTTVDNRMLIGGEDEDFTNPERRDSLLQAKSQKLKKKYEQLFPSNQFYTDFSWTGTFGETKDGLPYIGVHQDFPNSYFVLGFGGNGITFSVTGMQMASNWLRGESHELSSIFAFNR